ncbi:hypothetical protein EV182_003957, partial [Spiromyces aspiralis]
MSASPTHPQGAPPPPDKPPGKGLPPIPAVSVKFTPMPAKCTHTEADHEFDFEARPSTTTKAVAPTPEEARNTAENPWQTVGKPKSFADVIKAHPSTPSRLPRADCNKPAPLCMRVPPIYVQMHRKMRGHIPAVMNTISKAGVKIWGYENGMEKYGVYLYSACDSQRLANVPVILNDQIFHWGTRNGQFICNVIITESTPMDDGAKIKAQFAKLGKVKAFSKHIDKSGKWSGKWGCTLATSEPLPDKLPKLHIRHRGPALRLIRADQAICCHHCLCYGECDMIDQCLCIQMMAEYEAELAAAAAMKAAKAAEEKAAAAATAAAKKATQKGLATTAHSAPTAQNRAPKQIPPAGPQSQGAHEHTMHIVTPTAEPNSDTPTMIEREEALPVEPTHVTSAPAAARSNATMSVAPPPPGVVQPSTTPTPQTLGLTQVSDHGSSEPQ